MNSILNITPASLLQWVHICQYWDLRIREIIQRPTLGHPSTPATVHINFTLRQGNAHCTSLIRQDTKDQTNKQTHVYYFTSRLRVTKCN